MASATLERAVVNPIAAAKERTARTVNPGFLRRGAEQNAWLHDSIRGSRQPASVKYGTC